MSLSVKFWGVRGSLPSAPTPQEWVYSIEGHLRNFFLSGHRDINQVSKYMEALEVPAVGSYGLATTCVEVESARTRLIIDGGSGIRNLSENVMSGAAMRGKGDFHIYMTHFHWDHLIGLPFFTPHFVPGMSIHYYAVQPELEKMIRNLFQKPNFPVPFEALRSKIFFHTLEPRKPHVIGDMTITPYKLDHPDPCWGLKVESGGKVYSHCVDTEGTRVTREDLGEDLPLYQGVDMMYFDAQYTFPDLAEKANWGHSASQVGLDIGIREGIKNVIFSHHDPGATTSQILELKRQTGEYFDWRIEEAKKSDEPAPDLKWDFAWEGLVIKL